MYVINMDMVYRSSHCSHPAKQPIGQDRLCNNLSRKPYKLSETVYQIIHLTRLIGMTSTCTFEMFNQFRHPAGPFRYSVRSTNFLDSRACHTLRLSYAL